MLPWSTHKNLDQEEIDPMFDNDSDIDKYIKICGSQKTTINW